MRTSVFWLTKEKKTFIWASLIILLGQISVIYDSKIVLIIALLGGIIFSFFIDKNEILPFMLYLIAPNRSLTLGPISAPTIIMIIGVLRSLNDGKLRIGKKFLVYSMIFLIYCTATMGIGENQILPGIKMLVVLVFIWIFWNTGIIEKEYIKYVKCCSYGCIISAITALLLNPSSLRETTRFSITETGGENVLGIICAVMSVNLLIVFLEEKKHEKGSVIIAGCLIIIGLMTGSRSFLICIAMGIIGVLVVSILKLKIKRFVKILILLFFAIGVGVFVLNTSAFLSDYMEQLIRRINKLGGQDVSNGRYELWNQYISLFKSEKIHFWFGGLDHTKYGISNVAHNMILEQIASIGVVGSVIVFILYTCTYKHIIQKSQSRVVIFSEKILPMISLLATSFVSHTLLGVPQTIMLFICGIAILKSIKKEN